MGLWSRMRSFQHKQSGMKIHESNLLARGDTSADVIPIDRFIKQSRAPINKVICRTGRLLKYSKRRAFFCYMRNFMRALGLHSKVRKRADSSKIIPFTSLK